MEGTDAFLWIVAIIPMLCGGIGIGLVRRSRYLGIALISGAAGFAAVDIALLVFFSGGLV